MRLGECVMELGRGDADGHDEDQVEEQFQR